MIIPSHIQVEPINGVCTSRCIMCTYRDWTRDVHRMSNEDFTKVMEKFVPYLSKIEFLTLHGDGEALLDKELPGKIKIAKDLGFKGTGFATNCTLLNKDMSMALLEAGLDTIICSIDGIRKETHESIRKGTSFEQCVSNVENFIELRNSYGKTRVIVRFIRQELNNEEWGEYEQYWLQRVDKSFGDEVVKFDVHNWGDELEEYEEKDVNRNLGTGNYYCNDLYERIYIHSNGNIALCSADYNGFYELGNAITEDPISIYNSQPIIIQYRKMIDQGRLTELKYCETCTIPRSRALKDDNSE